MAEDPTITTKVEVHLKTRLSVEGAVSWAHPITELSCVVSASSGGGIMLSGNSIYFDRSVLGIPISSEIPTIGSDYFCPLELVVNGTTQYANMFVKGATATVTHIPNSTGYGEFTHPIDVVQAVRGTTAASSMCVPSELAVANALEHKQRLLSAGSFVSFTSGNVADILNVSGAVVIREYGQATYTILATEGAVRDAIIDASTACSSYAYDLTSDLGASVSAAGYATSTWVDTNYAKKSDIPDPGAVYTFTSGLSETVTGNTVRLVPAGNAAIGGVMVPTGSGLTLNTGTGELKLAAASLNAIGGVKVPSNSGLVLDETNGKLTVKTAESYADYAAAAAGYIGGVRVVRQVASAATTDTAYINSGYVPSVQAVWDWVSGATTAVQGWVQNNYVSTGGGIAVNWGTATANSLGVVMVPSANGLSVAGGTLTMAQAATNAPGAAAFPANHGLTLTDGSVTLSGAPVSAYVDSANKCLTDGKLGGVVAMMTIPNNVTALATDAPVVPTVPAVSAYIEGFTYATKGYVDAHTGINTAANYVDTKSAVTSGGTTISLGGVRVVKDTGIGVEAAGTTAGNIYGIPATTDKFGVVKVPSANGLSVANGTISLAAGSTASLGALAVVENGGIDVSAGSISVAGTTVYDTYAAAAAGTYYGGVKVAARIEDAPSAAARHMPIVPTVQAVYDAIYGGAFAVTRRLNENTTFDITGGSVYLDGLSTVYCGAVDSSITLEGQTSGTIWAIIYSGDGGDVSYAWAPSFGHTETSFPIAEVDLNHIYQCQRGPIVIRGRWV